MFIWTCRSTHPRRAVHVLQETARVGGGVEKAGVESTERLDAQAHPTPLRFAPRSCKGTTTHAHLRAWSSAVMYVGERPHRRAAPRGLANLTRRHVSSAAGTRGRCARLARRRCSDRVGIEVVTSVGASPASARMVPRLARREGQRIGADGISSTSAPTALARAARAGIEPAGCPTPGRSAELDHGLLVNPHPPAAASPLNGARRFDGACPTVVH